MIKRIKITLFGFLKKIHSFAVNSAFIRSIPGLSAIYDLAFRAFWPYPEVLEIEGSKMYLNVKEKDPQIRKTFQSYAISREWERSTTNLFKKVVKRGGVVVDMGANIGYFTLLAAKLVGPEGKVFSFEPEPRNYKYLQKNINLNNYKNVFAFQKAVSDRNGKTKLYLCSYDTGHHTINQPGGIRECKPDLIGKDEFIEIETIVPDEFLREKTGKIDVIKMDVEGAEMLALSGMREIIKNNRNIRMFIEFFPLLIKEMGSSPEDFLSKLLKDYHFSMFVVGNDYSMDKVSGKEYFKINDPREVFSFCKGKNDHVNLFLT